MSMSLREINALDRESKSREALAAAIESGGKEYRENVEALEKAVGGKAKIDKADVYYAKTVKAADVEAALIREASIAEGKARSNIIDEHQGALDKQGDALDQKEADQTAKSTALAEREAKVKAREDAAKKTATEQANTAAALAKREREVAEREADNVVERAELETWRQRLESAARPTTG